MPPVNLVNQKFSVLEVTKAAKPMFIDKNLKASDIR